MSGSGKSARFAEQVHGNRTARVGIEVSPILQVSYLCDHQIDPSDDHTSEKLEVTKKLRFQPVCYRTFQSSVFLFQLRQCRLEGIKMCNFLSPLQVLIKGLKLLPWTKKRTIIEIRGEKNAVPRVISCSISAGQVRSATVRDFCPALIAPDRAWYHTWNSVLLAANLEDGSFFVQGR